MYSPEQTRAAVEEAHRAGTHHDARVQGVRIAAEAGIDSIEHATLLDQQTICVIKEKNVALVPTFSALRRIIETAARCPPAVHRARLVATKHQEGSAPRTKRASESPLGPTQPLRSTRTSASLELVYLTEAGLSRIEALGSPKAGRITAGSWADLVFVDGDPLRDLEALQRPKAVWVRGVPVYTASPDSSRRTATAPERSRIARA